MIRETAVVGAGNMGHGFAAHFALYDRNGWLDVFVTNITDEYMRECNMLWHNGGDGVFIDVSRETGTCDSDWGWGGKFADLDNDGWEDIFTVNGLRSAGEENYIPLLLQTIITPDVDFSDLHSYPDIGDHTWSGYQRQRLFRNLGDGTFAEVAAQARVDNDLDGRGVAVADLDRDGLLDLVQTNARQPSLLFRNVSQGTGRPARIVGLTPAYEQRIGGPREGDIEQAQRFRAGFKTGLSRVVGVADQLDHGRPFPIDIRMEDKWRHVRTPVALTLAQPMGKGHEYDRILQAFRGMDRAYADQVGIGFQTKLAFILAAERAGGGGRDLVVQPVDETIHAVTLGLAFGEQLAEL